MLEVLKDSIYVNFRKKDMLFVWTVCKARQATDKQITQDCQEFPLKSYFRKFYGPYNFVGKYNLPVSRWRAILHGTCSYLEFFRGLCLLLFCFVFSPWTFDFEHCSLSPHVIRHIIATFIVIRWTFLEFGMSLWQFL